MSIDEKALKEALERAYRYKGNAGVNWTLHDFAKTAVEHYEAVKNMATQQPVSVEVDNSIEARTAWSKEHSTRQPVQCADDFTRIAVAKALCKWRNGKRSSVGFTELSMAEQHAYFEQADDAIAAYLERQPVRESGWRPIITAPKYKMLLLFAYHSEGDNWKMAVGSKGSDDVWDWDGRRLDKEWHLKTTHWQYLPEAPAFNQIESHQP